MRILKAFLLIVFVLFLVYVVGIKIWIFWVQRPIFKSDHYALLSGCRDLLQNRNSLRNDSTGKGSDSGIVVLNPRVAPLQENVPTVIKNMHPAYVTITTNEVMLCFSALPRVYVLGFREGAKEYGTTKLIDGLWFSNDPSRDRREAMNLNK